MFALRSVSSVTYRGLYSRCWQRQGTLRLFSVSPTRHAAEVPDIQPTAKEALRNSPTFQKLSQSPTALAAVKELSEVVAKAGVPYGSKPSALQMLKLAMNPEFQSVSKKVAKEFKDAGVDLGSKDVREEMLSLAKVMFTPKN